METFDDAAPPPDAGRSSRGEWTRALLPLLLLGSLRTGSSYGYAIGAALAERGLGAVRGATLYPLLARHEAAGLVITEWRPGDGGPGRKYFSLTPDGARELERLSDQWRGFVGDVDRLITFEGTRQ